LRALDPSLSHGAALEVKPTPMARPAAPGMLEDALVLEHALPLTDASGLATHILYGGRVLNRDERLVDRVRALVFDGRTFKGRPVGTVTFFLDDVRVATNVTDEGGERQLGTRVSEEVYHRVIAHGERWTGRAFVVDQWSLTSYEPVRDPDGAVIGMLYVGILEAPFNALARRLLGWFLLLLTTAVAAAVALAFWLAGAIARPVARLTAATAAVAAGDGTVAVESATSVAELQTLARAFGTMAAELKGRREGLERSNAELAAANQRYLDLVGFVAHELKGILASVILNAYAVRDGFLGIINFKQRRALDSVTRSLDNLDATVKNFLNLSRIERGQLAMNAADLELREDVVRPAVEEFAPRAADQRMSIAVEIPAGLRVRGDQALLQMVFNNLIGNAVKYGEPGGTITVRAGDRGESVAVEVVNDGEPLTAEQRGRLFHRFVRLDTSATRRRRGTGLGLFITREIVRQHGGDIRAEARDRGNAFVFTLRKEILHVLTA
jgi:two-component system NtrC family sensor kinase